MTNYESFMSPYLASGYRDEVMDLSGVEVSGNSVRATVSALEYYPDSTGGFHFSAPLAFVTVAQLALIYAHVDLGMAEKKYEVLVRSFEMRFRRQIQTTSGIEISLSLARRRRVAGAYYYRGEIDIADGSFTGRGSFLFPTGTGDHEDRIEAPTLKDPRE